MKNPVLIFLLIAVCFSCLNRCGQKHKIQNNAEKINLPDTIIATNNVIQIIAGSAYLKKAVCYFVIVDQDTSGFRPIFIESKDNGGVRIDLNLPYSNKSETYPERINQLKLILKKAEKEFNFDSLSSMSVGRLILTGDLAVEITREYKNQFGENEKITLADYGRISNFLLNSKFTKDINELFEPYSKLVETVIIEKAFFTSKDELLKVASITTDTADFPNQILDCITWISFKNK